MDSANSDTTIESTVAKPQETKKSTLGQRLIYGIVMAASFKFIGVLPGAIALFAHSEARKKKSQLVSTGIAIGVAFITWVIGVLLFSAFKDVAAIRNIFYVGFGVNW